MQAQSQVSALPANIDGSTSTSSADNSSAISAAYHFPAVTATQQYMTMEEVYIAIAASGQTGDILSSCASCGLAEVDAIKLMTCTACKLVRYCSVACQERHRPQHKRSCKKRMAELRDSVLFAQPNGSCHGDYPISAVCPYIFILVSM